MAECIEIVKKVCCTCLSEDRCLYKLCTVPEGVNNLYLLLSYDSEAFNEAFFRGVSSLLVCWECRAVLCKITRFRLQAGAAQRLLAGQLDGGEIAASKRCLSRLGKVHKTRYDFNIVYPEDDDMSNNFIDCGTNDSLYKSENSDETSFDDFNLSTCDYDPNMSEFLKIVLVEDKSNEINNLIHCIDNENNENKEKEVLNKEIKVQNEAKYTYEEDSLRKSPESESLESNENKGQEIHSTEGEYKEKEIIKDIEVQNKDCNKENDSSESEWDFVDETNNNKKKHSTEVDKAINIYCNKEKVSSDSCDETNNQVKHSTKFDIKEKEVNEDNKAQNEADHNNSTDSSKNNIGSINLPTVEFGFVLNEAKHENKNINTKKSKSKKELSSQSNTSFKQKENKKKRKLKNSENSDSKSKKNKPSSQDNKMETSLKHIEKKEKKNSGKRKSTNDTFKSNPNKPYSEEYKIYFREVKMNEKQMIESRMQRKMADDFFNASFKCEPCVEVFKDRVELVKHHLNLHIQKSDCTQCDICQIYMCNRYMKQHTESHYFKYICSLCDYSSYRDIHIVQHLRDEHEIQDSASDEQKVRKSPVKTTKLPKDSCAKDASKNQTPDSEVGSKTSENKAKASKSSKKSSDAKDSNKYQCAECDQCFHSNKQRWRHTRRAHREGFECDTCGQRFAFKTVLEKHLRRHGGPPPPRSQCAVCLKMVRCDLFKSHSLTHSARPTFSCQECVKTFISRASYEHHLKYTKAHAVVDVKKFKCAQCDKGYVTRAELRDHVNYQHMGRTQHQCPVCGKALATVRGVTRHVLRAHHGIKERAPDHCCPHCGKTFGDKKTLREHEAIHTGERPLTCELCGLSFRQSSSLYTHKKRVHQVYPKKVQVTLVDSQDVE